jgi:hypothetical protein
MKYRWQRSSIQNIERELLELMEILEVVEKEGPQRGARRHISCLACPDVRSRDVFH